MNCTTLERRERMALRMASAENECRRLDERLAVPDRPVPLWPHAAATAIVRWLRAGQLGGNEELRVARWTGARC